MNIDRQRACKRTSKPASMYFCTERVFFFLQKARRDIHYSIIILWFNRTNGGSPYTYFTITCIYALKINFCRTYAPACIFAQFWIARTVYVYMEVNVVCMSVCACVYLCLSLISPFTMDTYLSLSTHLIVSLVEKTEHVQNIDESQFTIPFRQSYSISLANFSVSFSLPLRFSRYFHGNNNQIVCWWGH